MPSNTEYVLTAYGIVSAVLAIYGIGVLLKLKSVSSRLKRIQNNLTTSPDEKK